MNYSEFSELIKKMGYIKNISITLLILLAVIALFYKEIKGIFDPLIITLLAKVSIIQVLLILRFDNQISTEIFYKGLAINLLFIFFLKIYFKNIKEKIESINIVQKKIEFIFFYKIHKVLFFLIIFFYFNIIVSRGIGNRLNIFQNYGFVNIFSQIIIPGQIILEIIKEKIYLKKSLDKNIILLISLISLMATGGKVSTVFFFFFIGISFYVMNITKNEKKNYKKKEKKFFLFCIINVPVLFYFSTKSKGIINTFEMIYFRILSEADIYYMYYPNSVYLSIEKIEMLKYYVFLTFRPILSRFTTNIPNVSLGFAVVEKIYNVSTNYFGPNTRAEIVWQENLNYLVIIIMIISTYIFVKIRRVKTNNFYKIYLLVLLNVKVDFFLRDFSLFSNNFLHGIFFFFIPLVVIVKTISKIVLKKRERDKNDKKHGINYNINI